MLSSLSYSYTDPVETLDFTSMGQTGQYFCPTRTPAAPMYLNVRSTLKKGVGVTSFTVRIDDHIDGSPNDVVNSFYFVVNGDDITGLSDALIVERLKHLVSVFEGNAPMIRQGAR
jgi:hypothetical protein